jgi:hypothetical protein
VTDLQEQRTVWQELAVGLGEKLLDRVEAICSTVESSLGFV